MAYMMLSLINRNFKHVTIPTFVPLYEYGQVTSGLLLLFLWTPYRIDVDIEALEMAEKRAAKMLPALKKSSVIV